MADRPAVSVVTALYNEWPLTADFLAALPGSLTGWDWECVLVDNASTDATPSRLGEWRDPRVRVFREPENRGYAAANNRGVREARAPVVALLNNDLVLTPGWLEPMEEALRPGVGIVGNVQWNARTGRIDHAGIVFNPWGMPEHWGQDYGRLPRTGTVSFRAVTAACCLLRREDFLATGGFDEGFRNGFEDVDYCLRAGSAGASVVVALASRVGHWVSASAGRKDADSANTRRFLARWGASTREWGLHDWPAHYLRRHLRRPWALNAGKTVDALLRLGRLRRGPSPWMNDRRRALEGRATGGGEGR